MTAQPRGRRPGLKAVADLAGVSVQTVSNVVNQKVHQMSAETKLRVEEAMRELNYIPNSQARGLRVQRTNTLALLLLDPDPLYLADPMTALIVSGVGTVARQNGYMVLVHASHPDQLDRGLFLPILQNRADGAVLLLSGEPSMRDSYIGEAEKLTSNLVVLEDTQRSTVSTVTADNRAGAARLTTHLLAAGHRRIAFLGSAVSWPMIEQRFAGYQDALAGAGVPFDLGLALFEGEWHASSGGSMATRLCDLPSPPTAIVAGNDLLAVGAIQALRSRGLRVPDDVAVAGFNDFDFAELTDPPLTTLRVPGFDIGRRAASLLIEGIEGRETAPVTERLPVELIIRGSA
jgi:DNA-binding LacI/PurR family transcriptional regulator